MLMASRSHAAGAHHKLPADAVLPASQAISSSPSKQCCGVPVLVTSSPGPACLPQAVSDSPSKQCNLLRCHKPEAPNRSSPGIDSAVICSALPEVGWTLTPLTSASFWATSCLASPSSSCCSGLPIMHAQEPPCAAAWCAAPRSTTLKLKNGLVLLLLLRRRLSSPSLCRGEHGQNQ